MASACRSFNNCCDGITSRFEFFRRHRRLLQSTPGAPNENTVMDNSDHFPDRLADTDWSAQTHFLISLSANQADPYQALSESMERASPAT